MILPKATDIFIHSWAKARNLLYILVNNNCEIEELNLESTLEHSLVQGKKIDILWDQPNDLSRKIVEEINDVINNGEPKTIPLQLGCIPVYSSKNNYWQCNFYPIFYNNQVKSVLVKLEDISHLMDLNINSTISINKNNQHPLNKQVKNLEMANTKLKLEEERFRLLVENIKDYAIFMLDENGFITTWNRGAEVIKQYKAKEIIGQHFSIFYTEDSRKKNHPQQELELAIKNGHYEEEDWRIKKDGSLFWANVIITPIYNDLGVLIGFGKVTRDLSERKKIEQIKNEFISVVSHELRTPLTSIRGSLNLLQESEVNQLSEKNKKLLSIAHNNCERLTRLINDVLDVEKIKDGKMIFNFEYLNLKSLIEEAIHLNEMYADKYDIHLECVSLIDAYVYVDADRLIQVLTNLISNAVKFSHKGGGVSITMSLENKSVLVAITDQGYGIPIDFKDKIFQRFSQADSSSGRQKDGTGLGLAISKAIIEQHHGSLDYSSSEHSGATFYFCLPLRRE